MMCVCMYQAFNQNKSFGHVVELSKGVFTQAHLVSGETSAVDSASDLFHYDLPREQSRHWLSDDDWRQNTRQVPIECCRQSPETNRKLGTFVCQCCKQMPRCLHALGSFTTCAACILFSSLSGTLSVNVVFISTWTSIAAMFSPCRWTISCCKLCCADGAHMRSGDNQRHDPNECVHGCRSESWSA